MEWIGVAFSILVAALILPAAVNGLISAGHLRENYRGRQLAFPLGAAQMTVALIALAPLAFLDDRANLDLIDPDLRRWMTYLIGIAFLGLIDDALGAGAAPDTPRGWRGHLSAVLSGRFSTGAVKALGAAALAAYAVSGTGREAFGFLADVALLILVTNLFNLFDTGPGRAEKALILLAVGLCLGATTFEPLLLTSIFCGPVLVGLAFTLRERAMLGDTGSNLLGAIAGVWLLTTLGSDARLIALAVALALTVYGEFRSISAAIRRIPPLRSLDSLGRPQ
jgi:UDP-GlcNAc:undecaprenyl-phosphate GlcNAc-1-phosphate transferase